MVKTLLAAFTFSVAGLFAVAVPTASADSATADYEDVIDCRTTDGTVVSCNDPRAIVEECAVDQYNMYCYLPGVQSKKPNTRGEFWCPFLKNGEPSGYYYGCFETGKTAIADIYELAEYDVAAAKTAFDVFWPQAEKFVGKKLKDSNLEQRRLSFIKSMNTLKARVERTKG